MKRLTQLLGASALVINALASSTSARAQSAPPAITVTINENGNGSITGGFSEPQIVSGINGDPGPGGQNNALTYTLPNQPSGFNFVAGDLFLEYLGAPLVSDIIRFNPIGSGTDPNNQNFPTIVFYSDADDGSDSIADTSGFPTAEYRNTALGLEIGPEGSNGATYVPLPGQPGYMDGYLVTYQIISDSAVPEPATWALMLVGFGAIGFAMRRSGKKVLMHARRCG